MTVPAYVFQVRLAGHDLVMASEHDLVRDTVPRLWAFGSGQPVHVEVLDRLCATCWTEYRLMARHGHRRPCYSRDGEG